MQINVRSGPGRRPKYRETVMTERTAFRVTPDLMAAIRRQAAVEESTTGDVIRSALILYLWQRDQIDVEVVSEAELLDELEGET